MRENKPKPLNILFVTPAAVGISPSQRFRHEQYLDLLKEKGIAFEINSFYSADEWRLLYKNGQVIRKIIMVLAGCTKRFFLLFQLGRFTHIYVHREATPVGPAFFEWWVSRLLKKNLIYDFDDAIWLPVSSEYNKLASSFRNFSKAGRICKWASQVSAGNRYLGDYALQYNKNVKIIPTVVDSVNRYNFIQDQRTEKPCIGWTGSFSTLAYLNILVPVLQELSKRIDFDFIVIADKNPVLPIKNYRFYPWTAETEITDLLRFHIGIMPLHNDEISKGKCGFKAIQYMSLGIPAVVSSVGVNTEIVKHGINGFICDSSDEWQQALETLLKDEDLRIRLGLAARKTIAENYSVNAISPDFISLFNLA